MRVWKTYAHMATMLAMLPSLNVRWCMPDPPGGAAKHAEGERCRRAKDAEATVLGK